MSCHLTWIPLEDWASTEQRARVESCWTHAELCRTEAELSDLGLSCLLVGGVVRDLALQRDNKDLDLVIDCSPSVLMKHRQTLAEATGGTAVPLDKERGILRLCFSNGEELDLVSRQGESLLEDLLRRDLTLNAMALSRSGALADPTQGLTDLRAGILRIVKEGNFLDDPLRAVRALRFLAQLGFEIETATWHETLQSMGELDRVAGERIRVELEKFWQSATRVSVDLLLRSGLRETLFPESRGLDELLLEISEKEAPTWMPGLAFWLDGLVRDSEGRDRLSERLKLSRVERKWLDGWVRGMFCLQNEGDWSLGQIFDLAELSGIAFPELAELLQWPSFPSSAGEQTRREILLEAQGAGRLRWDGTPWNGTQIAQAMGRSSGPWLGKAVKALRKRWALREIEELEEGLPLLELTP